MMTETAEESEGSGAYGRPGGAAAGRGATLEAASRDADAAGAGAGGRHGAGKRERVRVSGWREDPSGESYVVGIREGGTEASGVSKIPRGDRQGGGGRVESPRVSNTPGVEELPRGDKTSGVTPKGGGVPGAD